MPPLDKSFQVFGDVSLSSNDDRIIYIMVSFLADETDDDNDGPGGGTLVPVSVPTT